MFFKRKLRKILKNTINLNYADEDSLIKLYDQVRKIWDFHPFMEALREAKEMIEDRLYNCGIDTDTLWNVQVKKYR